MGDLIEQLGGTVAVARTLGVRHGAVTNWRRRGIPDGAKWRLYQIALAKWPLLTLREFEASLPFPQAVSSQAEESDRDAA